MRKRLAGAAGRREASVATSAAPPAPRRRAGARGCRRCSSGRAPAARRVRRPGRRPRKQRIGRRARRRTARAYGADAGDRRPWRPGAALRGPRARRGAARSGEARHAAARATTQAIEAQRAALVAQSERAPSAEAIVRRRRPPGQRPGELLRRGDSRPDKERRRARCQPHEGGAQSAGGGLILAYEQEDYAHGRARPASRAPSALESARTTLSSTKRRAGTALRDDRPRRQQIASPSALLHADRAHLLEVGDALDDLLDAVLEQRGHAVLQRLLAQVLDGRPASGSCA